MSHEMRDVHVCFRPLLEISDVLFLTTQALEEFPCRDTPEFKPWFPYVLDTRKPFRPLKPAPLISLETTQNQRDGQSLNYCSKDNKSDGQKDPEEQSGPEDVELNDDAKGVDELRDGSPDAKNEIGGFNSLKNLKDELKYTKEQYDGIKDANKLTNYFKDGIQSKDGLNKLTCRFKDAYEPIKWVKDADVPNNGPKDSKMQMYDVKDANTHMSRLKEAKSSDGLKDANKLKNLVKDTKPQDGLTDGKTQENLLKDTIKPHKELKDAQRPINSAGASRNGSEYVKDIIKQRRLSTEAYGSEPKRFQRSWCTIAGGNTPVLTPSMRSLSRPFRRAIDLHRLNLHQRVWWVVREGNCVSGEMEKLWLGINRAIRHHRLPTCNANFQRALAQIWLYCDLLYCEYIGNFLKLEFQLSGCITLNVHKLGGVITL